MDRDDININEVQVIQTDYINELENNPEFSLKVDPTNRYEFSDEIKTFIIYYVDYKDLNKVSALTKIDIETLKDYMRMWSVQQEIRRINRALYHHQFQEKLLDIDAIGGYLTSLLTDSVPSGDRLNKTEKLRVVELMLKINEMKTKVIENPTIVNGTNMEIELKSLSVKTITQLLKESNKQTSTIDIDKELTPEEKAFINTLPTKDILALIDDTNKENN